VQRVAGWLTTIHHATIGASLLVASALWLVVATAIGVILGFDRLDAGSAVVDAGALTQLFSLHRFALVFGVAAPTMLGLVVWSLPAQLHAANLSLPRLAAFGWWSWLVGSVIVLVSYLGNGGPGGGDAQYVETYLLGLGIVLVALAVIAVSVAATVLTRRNGRALSDVPVGAFAALVTALGVVLTLPVALGTIIYVWLDYVNARVAFGGADLINTWLGWVAREPHTLLVVVPALGVLADAVVRTARGRQPLRGVVLIGIGISLSVVASSATQQAHVFALGDTPTGTLQSFVPYALFNLLPLLAPLVVVMLSLLALRAGTPGISGAFVASFLGVGMIFTGLVGSAAMHLDALGLVGTVFGEATLVYVVYGAVLAAIGGITLHAGSVTGRAIPDGKVVLIALLGFVATVLASLPHYVAGFLDQPANVASGFDDSGLVGVTNVIVALGHLLMLVTLLGFVGLVATSRRGDALTDRYRQEQPA
jgi:heme/copper-type cytochrome/quinol oxidase subunit 1